MLKRFRWIKDNCYSLQLKNDLYTVVQLLEKPFVAFFNVTSECDDFDERALDLSELKPFGICAVLSIFIKTVSVGKVKNIQPHLNIPLPEIFISKDKYQWLDRLYMSDEELKLDCETIYNLVRIDPAVGDRALMGNEIVEYNIDKKDPAILRDYEQTGYNIGYWMVRRLVLSFECGRWVDPEKEENLLGVDNYPLKTVQEMWDYGIPKYGE